MNFDAVVVGAGPGGAFSAYWLAKNGLKVLLLEKKPLPRFKLCGGKGLRMGFSHQCGYCFHRQRKPSGAT
jgi:flavin-dependent dehydrogenase